MATTDTTEEIHGHAVLQMMAESGRTYSRDSLIAAVDETFGNGKRYVICCGGGMSSSELVDTLIAKGKFSGEADAFAFNPATMCDHE